MNTRINSENKEIVISPDRPFVLIGEKINPTGRKKLATALGEGNLDFVRSLVLEQVSWGADILDVNVGVPGIDEVAVMKEVVKLISTITDIPLCLDSANIDVLSAGLETAHGKPLVNSVSGEKKKLDTILPLVKDHNAAVIGLTMDDNGIPKTPEERVVIAEKILKAAAKNGISSEDVVIDPLVLTVGSDSKAALITIQTIEILRRSLGVNVNVGASNVSFGLPDRPIVNQAFLTLCIQAGATCAITDPMKLGQTVKAVDLLLGRDDNSMRYLKYFRAIEKVRAPETPK